MAPRYLSLGLTTGVTTFLLAGAVTVERLGAWYGDSPGVGILGISVGVVIGLLAGVVVTSSALSSDCSGTRGVWAFGITFLVIAGPSYANVLVPTKRSRSSFTSRSVSSSRSRLPSSPGVDLCLR